MDEHETKPTTVMRRDDLLELVNATAPSVSANAVPRVLLEQRHRSATENPPLEADLGSGVSPLAVLAILVIMTAMFVAIVVTA